MHNGILRKAALSYPAEVLPPYDIIMADYGFDALCTVVDLFGGATIYIPNKRTIFLRCLEREAVKEYVNGANFRSLINKYGFSERQLRRLIV